jgi:hypothetical protein
MLEAEPAELRRKRMAAAREFLQGVSSSVPTHLELASLADPSFARCSVCADKVVLVEDCMPKSYSPAVAAMSVFQW